MQHLVFYALFFNFQSTLQTLSNPPFFSTVLILMMHVYVSFIIIIINIFCCIVFPFVRIASTFKESTSEEIGFSFSFYRQKVLQCSTIFSFDTDLRESFTGIIVSNFFVIYLFYRLFWCTFHCPFLSYIHLIWVSRLKSKKRIMSLMPNTNAILNFHL